MSLQTLKTWEDLWEHGREAEMTHWNYSRGKIRYRPVLEEPEEIGTEVQLDCKGSVLVRFYTAVESEYVEADDHDVLFLPQKDVGYEVPRDFGDWDSNRQTQYLAVVLHKLGAARFAKQMDVAEKEHMEFLRHLQRLIDKKDAIIQELQRKLEEAQAQNGVKNIYEFLVHPNSDRAIDAIVKIFQSGRDRSSEMIEELKRLKALQDASNHTDGKT